MRFKYRFLICVFSLVLSSCFAYKELEREEIVFISNQLNGKKVFIDVELAITSDEKARGFMERKNIPEGTGMLFLYTSDVKMHFWMKNTPTPLSIAFISSDGVIKEIKDMAPYSLETVSSTLSLRYALEVPKGMFERSHLSIGDILTKDSLLLLRRAIAKK